MTIGMLSWGAPLTLKNTLESYHRLGLDRLDGDKWIFVQELRDNSEHISLAHKYGYNVIGNESNVGIAEAFTRLVNQARGDYFLFLEDDWELIEEPHGRFTAAQHLLQMGMVDVVRLRHRDNPGAPLWTLQFAFKEHERPTHMLDAVHWANDDYLKQQLGFEYFDVLTREGKWEAERFWLTGSHQANWTNNPFMAKTSFLKKYILPRIEGDIEISLQDWWQSQDFEVAMGDGLFTHNRIDR